MLRLSLVGSISVCGFMNGSPRPYAILVFAFRVVLRVILGLRRRDMIVQRLGFDTDLTDASCVLAISHFLRAPALLQLIRHESEVRKAVHDIRGEVFIDIGANIGLFTLLLERQFKRIISVEPEPRNFRELQRNVRHLSKKVECANVAISNANSRTKLYLSRKASHSLLKNHGEAGGRAVEVDSLTLEDLMRSRRIQSVELAKMDVEGAEWLVLEGARNVMPKITNWVIELHDWSRQEHMTSFLENCGYRCEWVGKRKHVIARRRKGPSIPDC